MVSSLSGEVLLDLEHHGAILAEDQQTAVIIDQSYTKNLSRNRIDCLNLVVDEEEDLSALASDREEVFGTGDGRVSWSRKQSRLRTRMRQYGKTLYVCLCMTA